MILHEYYFANLRPGAELKPAPTSKIAQGLAASFESVEQWRSDFHAFGGMRGIGCVLLCQDPVTRRLTNHWVTLHHIGAPVSFKPLLVLDVWEHAFMRDYKATEKGRYLEAFFRYIDWQIVEHRLQDPAAFRRAVAA
jgi:Fe-Mn family superoxide dismutase